MQKSFNYFGFFFHQDTLGETKLKKWQYGVF
jgi:hypothetical protein